MTMSIMCYVTVCGGEMVMAETVGHEGGVLKLEIGCGEGWNRGRQMYHVCTAMQGSGKCWKMMEGGMLVLFPFGGLVGVL